MAVTLNFQRVIDIEINGQKYEFSVETDGTNITSNEWRNVAAQVAKLFQEKIGSGVTPETAKLTLSGNFGSTINPNNLGTIRDLKVTNASYTTPVTDGTSNITTLDNTNDGGTNDLTTLFQSKLSHTSSMGSNAPSSTVPNTSNSPQTQNTQLGASNTVIVDERNEIYDRNKTSKISLAHALVDQLEQMPEKKKGHKYTKGDTQNNVQHLNKSIADIISSNEKTFNNDSYIQEISNCLTKASSTPGNLLPEKGKEIMSSLNQPNKTDEVKKNIIKYYCEYLKKGGMEIATSTYLKAFALKYKGDFSVNVKNTNGSTLYVSGNLTDEQQNIICQIKSCLFLFYKDNQYHSLNRTEDQKANLNTSDVWFQTKNTQTTNNTVGNIQQPQPVPQRSLTQTTLPNDSSINLGNTQRSTNEDSTTVFDNFTSNLLSTNTPTSPSTTESINPTESITDSTSTNNTHGNDLPSSSPTITPNITNATNPLPIDSPIINPSSEQNQVDE
jgi:hypothetical protein